MWLVLGAQQARLLLPGEGSAGAWEEQMRAEAAPWPQRQGGSTWLQPGRATGGQRDAELPQGAQPCRRLDVGVPVSSVEGSERLLLPAAPSADACHGSRGRCIRLLCVARAWKGRHRY